LLAQRARRREIPRNAFRSAGAGLKPQQVETEILERGHHVGQARLRVQSRLAKIRNQCFLTLARAGAHRLALRFLKRGVQLGDARAYRARIGLEPTQHVRQVADRLTQLLRERREQRFRRHGDRKLRWTISRHLAAAQTNRRDAGEGVSQLSLPELCPKRPRSRPQSIPLLRYDETEDREVQRHHTHGREVLSVDSSEGRERQPGADYQRHGGADAERLLARATLKPEIVVKLLAPPLEIRS